MMVVVGCGLQRNQTEIIFRIYDDHLRVCIDQAQMWFRTIQSEDLYWWIFYWLTHCLMHSVKYSGKLAMTTALFLRQKCLATRGKRTFTILLMPTCIHYYIHLYTVLALVLLYCGHCFSVWLPSKSCSGFPHCIIIFPQYMLALKAVSRSWHV